MIPLLVPLLLTPAGGRVGTFSVVDVDDDGADIAIGPGLGPLLLLLLLLMLLLTMRSKSIPRRFGLLQC